MKTRTLYPCSAYFLLRDAMQVQYMLSSCVRSSVHHKSVFY